jgi:hypothetical protein
VAAEPAAIVRLHYLVLLALHTPVAVVAVMEMLLAAVVVVVVLVLRS